MKLNIPAWLHNKLSGMSGRNKLLLITGTIAILGASGGLLANNQLSKSDNLSDTPIPHTEEVSEATLPGEIAGISTSSASPTSSTTTKKNQLGANSTSSPTPIINTTSGNSPTSSNSQPANNSNQSQANSATPSPTPTSTATPEPTQTPTPTPDSTPLTAEITTCARNGDTAIVIVTTNKPIKWCSVGIGSIGADISDPNGNSCSREFSSFQIKNDVKVYWETCAASVKSFSDEVVSLNKQVAVQ